MIYFPSVSQRRILLFRLIGVGLALVVIGIFLSLSGHSPSALSVAVIKAAVGSSYGLQQALILATPIILTGIGVSVSMRMGVWNVGAEGQLILGALFATIVGLNSKNAHSTRSRIDAAGRSLRGMLWALIARLIKGVC